MLPLPPCGAPGGWKSVPYPCHGPSCAPHPHVPDRRFMQLSPPGPARAGSCLALTMAQHLTSQLLLGGGPSGFSGELPPFQPQNSGWAGSSPLMQTEWGAGWWGGTQPCYSLRDGIVHVACLSSPPPSPSPPKAHSWEWRSLCSPGSTSSALPLAHLCSGPSKPDRRWSRAHPSTVWKARLGELLLLSPETLASPTLSPFSCCCL